MWWMRVEIALAILLSEFDSKLWEKAHFKIGKNQDDGGHNMALEIFNEKVV